MKEQSSHHQSARLINSVSILETALDLHDAPRRVPVAASPRGVESVYRQSRPTFGLDIEVPERSPRHTTDPNSQSRRPVTKRSSLPDRNASFISPENAAIRTADASKESDARKRGRRLYGGNPSRSAPSTSVLTPMDCVIRQTTSCSIDRFYRRLTRHGPQPWPRSIVAQDAFGECKSFWKHGKPIVVPSGDAQVWAETGTTRAPALRRPRRETNELGGRHFSVA